MSTNEISQKEIKRRKKWTAIFVSSIVAFTLICVTILYSKYDSLARYPYSDAKSRELIKEYLNRDEIEYIIEYSIAPNMFVSYIAEDGFNIYHASEYKKLSESQWEKSPSQIVQMVEETYDVYNVDQLSLMLVNGNYEYETIHNFLTSSDPYGEKGILIQDAMKDDVYVNSEFGVWDRKPLDLVHLDESIPCFKQNLQISKRLEQPLLQMFDAIQKDLESNVLGAQLQIKNAYLSYADLANRFDVYEQEYGDETCHYVERPGHSEHQLGLAVDFAIDGLMDENFNQSIQYQWLKQHAYEYGFIETYTTGTEELTGQYAKPYHFRYVGIDLAKQLHDANTSFASYEDSLLYE